jgi:hypothetical protein
MAGTLTLSTLSDGTSSTSATNPIKGSARAWVYFNGGNGNTAGVINGSYNVSSITVNSTGNFLIYFTNAMPNTNYAVLGSGGWASAFTGIVTKNEGATNTAYVQVFTAYQNGANYAIESASVAIFGT